MTLSIANASKASALTSFVTGAGSTSTIVIYTGTAPLTADTALSGNNVIVSCPCSATAGVASNNVLTFNAITQTNATLAGTNTATFYRWLASNGTTVIDQGSIGVQVIGAMASFATNVMTLNTAPTTNGPIAIGQQIQAAGVTPGTTILSLASGTINVVGSTYNLSTTPGTIANESIITFTGEMGLVNTSITQTTPVSISNFYLVM